jgi:hypothetical protein
VIGAAALFPLEWARPYALLALALPLAVLLGSRLFERPFEIATGTLDLWRRARAAQAPPSRRARTRIPPAVWILVLALTLGALALAGPRPPSPEAWRALHVLVDRTPSMELALGKGTRRDRALAMARAWIERTEPDASVEWAESAAPLGPGDDREDALWVTDRAPFPPPRHAGFVASGGPSVPGPVAIDGTARYDWDGERLVEVPGGAPVRRVEVSGTLPAPLAGVLDAWARARGVEIAGRGEGRSALVVHAVDPGLQSVPVRTIEAGRDGWTATGTVAGVARSSDPGGPLETWLADLDGRAVVTSGPGRIDSRWASMEDAQGDPAAFAVSWARLFDAAVLPPPGVIELAERLAAGEEASAPPRAAEPAASESRSLAAWLALASLAGAVVALILSNPRSRGS